MFDLETQILSWSDHLRAHGNFSDADILELEDHLRDEIEDLIAAGLTPDESFLISVKRLGNIDMGCYTWDFCHSRADCQCVPGICP